jgi:hypothetical protein
MSMRSKREMIGKLGETGTKGPREQGINDLRRRGRGCLGAARLDTVLGWGQESGKTKGTSRLSLGSIFLKKPPVLIIFILFACPFLPRKGATPLLTAQKIVLIDLLTPSNS